MKILAGMTLVMLPLAMPAPVRALGMETFGNAPAVQQADWAEGILAVVNLKSRVYSRWVNGNESFFYRGDAGALNEALKKYAAVKDDVRRLILLPGSGETRSFARKPVAFDWELHVPSGIYKAMTKRSHAVLTVHVSTRKQRGPVDRKGIEKWLAELDHDSFERREKATGELRKLGRQTRPFLRQALKGRLDLEARRRIEGLLKEQRGFDVGDLEIPKGLEVISVDDLLAVGLQQLKDANPTVCSLAIQELSGLAPYSDKVVPALVKMLEKGKNDHVRRVAAACLAGVGVKARSAVGALKEGLKDPDAGIRAAFQDAIKQIESAKDRPGQAEEVKNKLAILQDINELKKAAGGK
jgi:hypothetical protein